VEALRCKALNEAPAQQICFFGGEAFEDFQITLEELSVAGRGVAPAKRRNWKRNAGYKDLFEFAP